MWPIDTGDDDERGRTRYQSRNADAAGVSAGARGFTAGRNVEHDASPQPARLYTAAAIAGCAGGSGRRTPGAGAAESPLELGAALALRRGHRLRPGKTHRHFAFGSGTATAIEFVDL